MQEIAPKKGISETLKVLQALKTNIMDIMSINWTEVVEELKDADATEVKDLVIEIMMLVIKIISSLKLTVGPISTGFKLLQRFKII